MRIKESVTKPRHDWGQAKHGMVGRLHKKKSDEIWLVDFPEIDDTYWRAHPSELEPAPLPSLSEGDIVRVKKGVHQPRYGFGEVTHASVGRLHAKRSDEEWLVDFPQKAKSYWSASPWELEKASLPNINVGDKVRVRRDVSKPAYGWDSVSHSSVGRVHKKESDKKWLIDFPDRDTYWSSNPLELELANNPDGELSVGTWVRIKESVTKPRHDWGQAKRGMVGRLYQKKSDEIWLVDFPEIENTYWRAHPSELEAAPLPSLSEGDIVRVKKGVHRPRYGFGSEVTHASVGRLHAKRNDERWVVDFPQQADSYWSASPWELEKASLPNINVGYKVRVRRDVSKPTYGWGGISHSSVGRVHKKESDKKWLIDFPGRMTYWSSNPLELELATDASEAAGITRVRLTSTEAAGQINVSASCVIS